MSVYQRTGRKGWYIEYRDAQGRRHNKLTTAKTKTEARRLLLELERSIERQRLGLEELPEDSRVTLGELVEWWLKERCSTVSRVRETSRMQRHVLPYSIAATEMRHLTGADIDERLREMEAAGFAPASVEHVRRKLRAVINAARKAGRWKGASPLAGEDAPEARRIPKTHRHTLTAEEVPLVLQEIAPQWRAVAATAIYTGMRKGEVLALEERYVDLRAGLIVVARSWDRDTTKSDEHATIPIAAPLLPYLQAAIEASRSRLVFPRSDGTMHPESVNLTWPLRTALARAGIVEGWDHICRRCKSEGKKEHTWRHEDGESRRCPTCTMRLWPKPIPRPVRWHDLRHTTATLLLREGVPFQHVQRLLRHQDIQTTIGTYAHIVAEDLRDSLGKLPGAPAENPAQIPARALPDSAGKEKPPKSGAKKPRKSGVSVAGDVGLEPTTFGFEGRRSGIGTGALGVAARRKPLESLEHGGAPQVVEWHRVAPDRKKVPAQALPDLRLVPDPLLTVREVAASLRVSTATVYGIIQRGQLPARRISGALRVRPEDLEAYREGAR